ncbi:MAG: type II toxin-antitoxin system PemK/MazF family toxin [Desulfobacterales bacterium]|nr:type II toxin-antitoxin system PemK/MazF family toxin [Desulfobacterales bacterium]
MDVENGSIYWVNMAAGNRISDDGKRPFLAVQSDILNASRINTVVMLGLTDRTEFSQLPGNVTLEFGEANLPQRYIVNVSQMVTFEKKMLAERIGSIDDTRMRQVYDGIRLVLNME